MLWCLQKATKPTLWIVVDLIFKREGQRCSTEHSNCQAMFKANLFPFIRSQRNFFCLLALLFKLLDNMSAGHFCSDDLIKIWGKSSQADLSLEQQIMLFPRISVRTNFSKIKVIDVQNSPKTFFPQRPGWAQVKHTDMKKDTVAKPLQTQGWIGPKQSQT